MSKLMFPLSQHLLSIAKIKYRCRLYMYLTYSFLHKLPLSSDYWLSSQDYFVSGCCLTKVYILRGIKY